MDYYNGKIIKGIGGFYYVKTENGIIECRARGKFRKDSVMPFVGDNVQITVDSDGSGYVVSIHDRKNCFVRPPISNIDKLLIVSSMFNPQPDTIFIDKMLVYAEMNNVRAALCFNKSDLSDEVDFYKNTYAKAGYEVFVTSAKDNVGIDELKSFMKSSTCAVCGFSGVGKSTILNLITGYEGFESGEISQKLSRGKHTTRHVELFEYEPDSYIADTPGFSMMDIGTMLDADELIKFFPDLNAYSDGCKFSDCTHTSDKFCAVYDAFESGEISQIRYENYKYLYNDIINKKHIDKRRK